ncbi:MAG: isoleucine--tRNA ligase [Phycisphaeraceae bacterium]
MTQPDQAQQRSYKKTLNLPRTPFAMRANLVQNEPASLKRWDEAGLYQQLRAADHPAGRFTFHDGPPYANGSIHLGHLENKVLKDFVVRTRTMAGYDTPYIPGWDCHGLPIEHKVVQDLGDKARDMAPMQIRKRCRDYAEKYVKLQAKQMQRLLTLADYDNPYLTMSPAYEAAVLEVFAELVAQNLVYRGLKPVHWSIENQTALAEAELEYHEREDTSVYVLFELTDATKLPPSLNTPKGAVVNLLVWTTTPWTLSANMAVAVRSGLIYCLYEYVGADGERRYLIANDNLAQGFTQQSFFDKAGITYRALGGCGGSELENLRYHHPFISRTAPVISAPYVTAEDGTGLVHTAPGHGREDFEIANHYRLHWREGRVGADVDWIPRPKTTEERLRKADAYCPVRADGTFDETAPDWLQGKNVWEANDLVVEHLRNIAHLFHKHTFSHSYPHDWRGTTPVIFRATEQWFLSVDFPIGFDLLGEQETPNETLPPTLRQLANKEIDGVEFIPAWGRNRLRGMLETRPDWCLSRQRAWGLPIPAFYNGDGEVLLTPASVRAVADIVRAKGSDAWFTMEPHELLAGYDAAGDADAPDWAFEIRNPKSEITKGSDIFDVWFESGSSWHAVLHQRQGADAVPADLYLEGSDQHRGWFQTSLLPALGATGRPPYKALLTHGFTVDREGKKMSKSVGNTLEVEELLKTYGADVCRWWVSGLAFENDVKVDESFFKDAGDEYRKVRNTIRFLLSNLSDFDPSTSRHAFGEADATSIEAWAMHELDRLVADVRSHYKAYAFRRAHERLFNFCNDTLSAVYLAAVKDRLYCDKADAPRRRRTQTALHEIADALIRLLAPLLPHTADEAWRAMGGDDAPSVHLERFPATSAPTPCDPAWADVISRRDGWLRAVETYRQAQEIDNPLDLGLRIAAAPDAALRRFDPVDLADLCGLSRVEWADAAGDDVGVEVLDLRDEPRCERSWKRDGTVRQRSDGGQLSDRDADAMDLV